MSGVPLKWMPAAAYGGPFRAPAAVFVVIHCTESDNAAGTAESLAGPGWFGGPKAGTSAHRMFDRDSGVEMVRGNTVAYHAGPGGNTWGRSYEFCGRASWTAAQWRAPEQLAMLRLAAPHIADDLIDITGSRTAALNACRWLSVVQVAQHAHGLCTHNDIRLALGGTTHSDPGPNFPYAELLAYVRAELTGTPITEEDDVTDDDIAKIVAQTAKAVSDIIPTRVWDVTAAEGKKMGDLLSMAALAERVPGQVWDVTMPDPDKPGTQTRMGVLLAAAASNAYHAAGAVQSAVAAQDPTAIADAVAAALPADLAQQVAAELGRKLAA